MPGRSAVIAIGIARRDQQGAVADHLGKLVPHPFRITRVFNAGGQPFGDLEALLDGCPQQDPGVRGQPAAVESHMHGLAHHRWQARQNFRSFRHGGGELPWLRLIRFQQPNHTRNQRFIVLPPAPSCAPVNYPGQSRHRCVSGRGRHRCGLAQPDLKIPVALPLCCPKKPKGLAGCI
jgi:hypothetical protein